MNYQFIKNIHQMQRKYTINNILSRRNLTNELTKLLKKWLYKTYIYKINDPTAICLATLDPIGQPNHRLVLLKYIDKKKSPSLQI